MNLGWRDLPIRDPVASVARRADRRRPRRARRPAGRDPAGCCPRCAARAVPPGRHRHRRSTAPRRRGGQRRRPGRRAGAPRHRPGRAASAGAARPGAWRRSPRRPRSSGSTPRGPAQPAAAEEVAVRASAGDPDASRRVGPGRRRAGAGDRRHRDDHRGRPRPDRWRPRRERRRAPGPAARGRREPADLPAPATAGAGSARGTGRLPGRRLPRLGRARDRYRRPRRDRPRGASAPATASARSTSSSSSTPRPSSPAPRRPSSRSILQISENAVRYHGALAPIALATLALARAAVRAGRRPPRPRESAELAVARPSQLGFNSVMFDASKLPYDEQPSLPPRAVAARCHAARRLGRGRARRGRRQGRRPRPRRTHRPGRGRATSSRPRGVDALAVAVGTLARDAHPRRPQLDLDLIAALRDAVPVPLVLHGSVRRAATRDLIAGRDAPA